MGEKNDILELWAPDWGNLDTVRRSPLPFVLWEVGDQCLLAHWLDEAFNRGHTGVVIHVADRPAEVRRYCEEATLWPMDKRVVAVAGDDAGPNPWRMDRLPWQDTLEQAPEAGWGLLQYQHELEGAWFEHTLSMLGESAPFLMVGRHCQIHPSAQLVAPYWIGDGVSIGPGCRIGPNAAIGHGSLLAGPSLIENARIHANTYLAPDTELRDALLEGTTLYNRRLRAVAGQLDAVIAGEVSPSNGPRIGPWQRMRALLLWWRHRPAALAAQRLGQQRSVTTLSGEDFTLLEHADPRIARWPMLPSVIKGQLPLVGIPPYDASGLAGTDPEWRESLRHAPVGVFGLSDVQCPPGASIEERILHDVYQANCQADEAIRIIVNNWLRAGGGSQSA